MSETGPVPLAGRPRRDPRVEDFAANGRWWNLLLMNTFGYAGDDPDPRPLPYRTLYTIKQQMSDYLQAGATQRAQSDKAKKRPWAWDAFQLAFCSSRVKMPLDEVIPVPREDLWWMAAPDDLVLLSDRVTHHYTTVDQVAREADRIFFIDEWPDRIFLKAGLNAAGVEAQVDDYMAGVFERVGPQFSGKKHVSITRDEFLRVIVGLVTLDTPALFERYLAYRPEAKASFAARYAFGAALMDVEMDRLAKFAVPHFKAACRIGAADPRAGDADEAVARLYQALVIARFVQQYGGDPLASKPFADELGSLFAHQAEENLLDRLSVEQIARIGNAAGHAQEFQAALGYLDRAVARGPAHEGARHLRAMARSRTGDWPSVLEDITAALAANAERISVREAARDARDPRDRHGLDDDNNRLAGLRSRRLEELGLRFIACGQLQQWPQARAAAEEAVALAPDRPEGHRLLGALAAQAGQMAEARLHLSAALEREKSPRGRTQLEKAVASLAAGHQGAPG